MYILMLYLFKLHFFLKKKYKFLVFYLLEIERLFRYTNSIRLKGVFEIFEKN